MKKTDSGSTPALP